MRNGAHWSNSGGSTICGKRGDRVCDRSTTRTPSPASAPASSFSSAALIDPTVRVPAPSGSRGSASRCPARRRPDRCPRRRRAAPRRWLRERGRRELRRRTSWFHSSSIGPGKTFTTRMPARRISARRVCDSAKAAAFEAENVPCDGQRRQRIDRQQVDPGGRAGTAPSAARARIAGPNACASRSRPK